MQRLLFFTIIPIHFLLGLPYLGLIYLVGIFDYRRRIRMAYGYNRLTSWWLYTIAGAKIEAEGLENLKTDSNVLYVSNHRSMLDIPLMILHSKDPIIFIGKSSIRFWPFIGWWLHAMGGLYLDRDNAREGLKTILAAIERIKGGESCIIFPEGTRSQTREMLPFKQGSLKLASKTGVPIIPISILGTADVFENNFVNLKPETVYFSVGKPIHLSNLNPEDKRQSAAFVQSVIDDMYQKQLKKRDSAKQVRQ